MAHTQEHRIMRVTTPLGEDELLITALQGHEEISRLFQFDLTLISQNHRIAFDQIIGTSVTVALTLSNGEERFFNGQHSPRSPGGGLRRIHGHPGSLVLAADQNL